MIPDSNSSPSWQLCFPRRCGGDPVSLIIYLLFLPFSPQVGGDPELKFENRSKEAFSPQVRG